MVCLGSLSWDSDHGARSECFPRAPPLSTFPARLLQPGRGASRPSRVSGVEPGSEASSELCLQGVAGAGTRNASECSWQRPRAPHVERQLSPSWAGAALP